jgi:ribosomal protein S18 acetylase RimI-like enzyme
MVAAKFMNCLKDPQSLQNGMICLKFKKLDMKKHSSYKVAELLYEKDHTIFNFLYGNKSKSANILEKLIVLGENNLGHENIYVVTKNELVIGVLLYSTGNHSKLGDLKFHFKNLNIVDALKFLLIELKDSLILSHLKKCDFYMAGIAVNEEFRGQGVGSLILNSGINVAQKMGCKRVVLDVALDNLGAKRLYEKLGFEVFDKKSYPWFGGRIGMYNMDLNIK